MSGEANIIAQILAELKAIQETPFPRTSRDQGIHFPSFISAGEGMSLIINSSISKLITELAARLHAARPSLANKISKKDWSSLVQRAIGPILGAIDLNDALPASADLALTALNDELDRTDWNFHKRTFLFGCSLIDHREIPTFSIGPVAIRSRNAWLESAFEQGLISKATYRRLFAFWSGKKLRQRKGSVDSSNERNIIDAIGKAPFVCSVETDGLFGEFAKQKAFLAAQLTTLGIALMWASPSKALQDINFVHDGPPYSQTYTFYQDRPELLSGRRWVNSLHGLSLFGDSWEALVAQRNDWWAILAETIHFLLNGPKHAQRPALMNSFAHALIWFHEGCREPISMIAITKYMSCLDALACGRKARGITALVSARLGVEPYTSIRKDGASFKAVIDDLYSEGRSRLLHGNSNQIGNDWEDSRGLAETLARLSLISCFRWAAEHTTCDDPKQMAEC